MHRQITVRNSKIEDMQEISAIYAHEVLHGLASFEVRPPDREEMTQRWNRLVEQGYPYLVATIDNQVAGYAYVGPYRTRPAYRNTLENSVYVAHDHRGAGIGKILLRELITACESGHWHTIVAIIGDKQNAASIALHGSVGFHMVGTIEAVGYKHDQWVDTIIMQKMLND